ncbi:MAG: hypothetical protein H7Y88_06535 [Phycisphaerales bacterium]|nr:hypothetical protein [Phycisphaerales bacterium]
MSDPRDTFEPSVVSSAEPPAGSAADRAFLRLWFRCANQYARAAKASDGTCYLGRCPRCAKTIRFPIGPGGTSKRFFEVSCN